MMKAAVLYRPYELGIDDVPVPEVGPGQVLIRVSVCGLCGTDVNLYTGTYTARRPVIIGHEFAGEVAATGPGVALDPGTTVTVDPNESCGACYWCHSGQPTFCQNMPAYGVLRDGGFAEYVLVGERGVYPLPQGLEPEQAAFAEPVSCAVHGADQAAYRAGGSALIIGDGPMGLLQTQLAAQAGLSRLIVLGHHPRKLELARAFGADVTLAPADGDLRQAVLDHTGGLGAEVVVVAVGKAGVIEQAFDLAKEGGRIVIFGFAPEGERASFSPFQLLSRELSVVGSWVNPYTFPRALDLLASGKVQVAPFITHRIGLGGLQQAIEMMQSKPQGFIKAMVGFQA